MREGEKKESRIKGTKGVVKIFLPFNASFTPLFVGDVKNGRNFAENWSNFGQKNLGQIVEHRGSVHAF